MPTQVGSAYEATVAIDVDAPGRPVNRRILGGNAQWTDRGDNLLAGNNTTAFAPRVLADVTELRPTVLRYPGGGQSDIYRWRDGIGPLAQRGNGRNTFNNRSQRILFGTDEFLDLCRRLGAEPLITVNVGTGTAEEAAEWVRYVNGNQARASDGGRLGPVRLWEIGNEPYLKGRIDITPDEYARRANEFIRAMRRADASITVGIPLLNDTLGRRPAAEKQGFARTVLQRVTEPFDFVAVHDAYMPLLWDAYPRNDEDLFRGTMAAYRVLERDLDRTRALLAQYRPGRRIPVAITEYAAFFSAGTRYDNHARTLGGALWVADALRVMAERDDVLMANYWSLTDNGFFGAVSSRQERRPVFYVLRAYDEVLRGRLVPARVTAPTFSSPAVASVPATADVPSVTALATRDGGVVRLLVVNKDLSRPASVSVRTGDGAPRAVTFRVLTADAPFARLRTTRGDAWEARPASPGAPTVVEVPPHSMGWVELTLGR